MSGVANLKKMLKRAAFFCLWPVLILHFSWLYKNNHIPPEPGNFFSADVLFYAQVVRLLAKPG